MALDPQSGRRSASPESSGRDSPIPRQWRSQLGGADPPIKDKAYRRYAAGVDKALSLFETTLEEWADYISFLNRLLKALQARPSSFNAIPAKALVARRLSQCLNPSLPSGVHQKTLDVYNYIFTVIGKDGLSRDLPLYLPGLAPTLSFASLSVRSPFLDLLQRHLLGVNPRSLRPAMKSIVMALLPGLEEETSEDFEHTLRLVAKFKEAIRPDDSDLLTDDHSSGDSYFWQCFFLASITSQSRRSGALAYLVRYLPSLGQTASLDAAKSALGQDDGEGRLKLGLSAIVTSPEPGLLIRCFASGLSDEQLLIQRGFLDLLVTHLPLNSTVLQSRVKSADLELLVKAAAGVVTRRDMSLNRRLWSWLLGPEPAAADGDHSAESEAMSPTRQQNHMTSTTAYFEEFGLQPLTKSLLGMIKGSNEASGAERARPYRICLSLMDRWEIGGLVVPEVFLPVVDSVRQFKKQASSRAEFSEVLRSASVFFDGIESGLIYGELVGLLAQAIGPGGLTVEERTDKIELVDFIIANFNIREEEMITTHAPLAALAALCMLEDANERRTSNGVQANWTLSLAERVFSIISSLLDLIPERAFPRQAADLSKQPMAWSNVEALKKIKEFYVSEQGNTESAAVPFAAEEAGQLLLSKAVKFVADSDGATMPLGDLGIRLRILLVLTYKTPRAYKLDDKKVLTFLEKKLGQEKRLPYSDFSSILQLSTQLYNVERISASDLSNLVRPLVRHAWSYISAPDPKHQVETVRCLWQLQTALTASNRDVEAALAELLASQQADGEITIRPANVARSFGVLWSHTLQDSPSERRGSKNSALEARSSIRLAGMDHYELMLTQPLFLVLDALLDERTQLFMTVKSWLTSMIGIDRMFLIFVSKLLHLPFLQGLRGGGEKLDFDNVEFSEDDDLDLCLYYLRTLSHVLRCSGDVSWVVLASKYLSFNGKQAQISTGGDDDVMTLQEFFVRVCVRCIMGKPSASATEDLSERSSQLYRFALTILHQFFLSQHASGLGALHLEDILIDRLLDSIDNQDPYVQVLLLDVVLDSMKLKEKSSRESPPTPLMEKRSVSADPPRNSRPSLSLADHQPATSRIPPAQLLKCLSAGLSSATSRSVLDSWVAFLSECLPFYADTIFQVLIPLVETLCKQIGVTFSCLRETFRMSSDGPGAESTMPESTLIYLLNGLEQVLARAHDQLLAEESRVQPAKSPDQSQSLFGSMVSGVFQSDAAHSRSATANDRLTVHLAFQDAVRICFSIWAWGQDDESYRLDSSSTASFSYTSLRMRNRARRLLEHLFTAETLECLETIIDVWKNSPSGTDSTTIFKFLGALDASRPRHTMPALFNAIYSRTNPSALDPSRKSTMTISLQDTELVVFLVEYARTLDDDAMDEIWQDCMTFLKDLLNNPFPHRQTLPSLLEFAAILGEKVDNTNFGEQKRMRRELGDLFLRLLAAIFTTRPMTFQDVSTSNGTEKRSRSDSTRKRNGKNAFERSDDVVLILSSVVSKLPKILIESDRALSAAGTISTNVIGPTLRSRSFPETVSEGTVTLLHELSRLQNNQKTWKRDVGEAFNDARFLNMNMRLVKDGWLPLLRQWVFADKDKILEIVSRINPPSTAGIVFGVGATSARLEADRKTQLNLRRVATLVLACAEDTFAAEIPDIFEKLVELLAANATSSPSSTTRADIYMVVRALVLKTSPIHLALLWPVVNAEIQAAVASVVAPDNSTASEVYTNPAVFQACKLLDLLICVAPDDFQLHEWLFITDTIDAVYKSSTSQPVALVDELSEELGNASLQSPSHIEIAAHVAESSPLRQPLLATDAFGEAISLDRKDELVSKILRPFFGQLSIFAFESTYAMSPLDQEACVNSLLRDIFDERSIVKAL